MSNLYLTDKDYGERLLKISNAVNDMFFKPTREDSTTVGAKYTTTNCGMCNDEFTTKESAMFPEDFPQRKSSKYGLKHHVCPFDRRMNPDGSMGCFYDCYVFKKGRNANVQHMRNLVHERIAEAKQTIPAVRLVEGL